MRDDLLDAQAAVDWTVAQFPSLQGRINSWLKLNISVEIEETDSGASHNIMVAIEKEPLPRAFTVEIGAYINTLRSSLDILATSLAERYRVCKPEDAYFPVAPSAAAFMSGKYKGAEFVQGLPLPERMIIESLKPHKGGNELLSALHQLDIERKHRRLIGVDPSPQTYIVSGWGDSVTPVAKGWMRANDKTVIAHVRKGAPQHHARVTPHITFGETSPMRRKPVIATLNEFASLAASIIKRFDT